MDKWMDNSWFMKIVALALALLFFSAVPNGEDDNKEVNVPSERNKETIEDVPVKTYYDTKNFVVSGVPETVDVTIQGPSNLVQTTKALRNFEVYVDLSKADLGEQRVPIQVKDLSEKLKVTISPASINVTVLEKVTKEFKVEAEFNTSMIEEGYIAESPIVEPNKVKITGAKETIDRISYVKATVNEQGTIQGTIKREASIRVLDRDLNKLDVLIEPETVEVIIPVKSSNKTVPINLVQKGTPPSNISIESINLDTKEAKIIGNEEALKETENVRVEVDVSNIKGDTELTLPVIISEGIVKVTPETVKVRIKVKQEEEKVFSNIPIKSRGLSERYNVDIQVPENGNTNVTAYGPIDLIRQLKATDFDIFIDLSSLEEGEHEVPIQVEGSTSIGWKLAVETAKISITQKEEI